MWEIPTRTVDLDSARVRIAERGEGPPLLLINGIGGNIEMWEPATRHLRGRRLVMIDMPGTGESPLPRIPRRMRGYARLCTELLDELEIDRADVLGYSWGGTVAQQLAHDHPQRVGSLVLAATTPGLGGQPPAPWVLLLMTHPARYYSRAYLRMVAPVIFGTEDPERTARSEHADARLWNPPTMRGYAHQLYAISGWTSLPWLRTLTAPTLVLAGTADPLAPERNSRMIARCIPDARLATVAGGHLFLMERPAGPCAMIDAFLDEHAATTATAPAMAEDELATVTQLRSTA